MRPYIREYEKHECKECVFGEIRYKTSGGNKARKMCELCSGTGYIYDHEETIREATDDEWMEQLEARIEALEARATGGKDEA